MNAVDTVAAVRRAEVEVEAWEPGTRAQVAFHLPLVAVRNGASIPDWQVTVCLLRRDWETPETAADRLATYMTLHAERWDETPTLATLNANHLEER